MKNFYLDFTNDATAKVAINEPIGFADISWDLKQKDKGYGRDVYFNGGESQLTFVSERNHYLDKILYYFNYFGFESKILLIVESNGVETNLGELDFATAQTDELTYFNCKVVQDSALQIIKRRKDVKVDLFSNKDLDGNTITPLIPQNTLILAKASKSVSQWTSSSPYYRLLAGQDREYAINNCQNIAVTDLNDTFTFFNIETNNLKDFQLLQAKDNLKNITINISGASVDMATAIYNGYIQMYLKVAYGTTFETATELIIASKYMTENQTYSEAFPDFNVTIPNLQRGDSIWIAFTYRLKKSGVGLNDFKCNTITNISSILITGEGTSYNSICPSFRLVDVISQIIKSVSGLNITAPRFSLGGQFYDNRLLNGSLLRNIINKGFLISLKDIEDSIVEMNADYEINNTVFFGIYDDFYNSEEIKFFDNIQYSEFKKEFNPFYSLNEFKYSYKKFQSLKENEDKNTADTIHGDSTWLLPNKLVENKLDVNVEWVRDSFLLENIRQKSYTIDKDTATQNDDDIFCLDTKPNSEDKSFDEVTILKHEFDVANNRLILRNSNDINFSILGIFVGSIFIIDNSDVNAGNYTVFSVSGNEINLTRTSTGVIGSSGDGIRSTKYKYRIESENIPFISYTNEGFTATSGLISPDSYFNLRYSIKRNIINYYSKILATAISYNKTKNIKNTFYKNNPDCITTYGGLTTKEGQDFNVTNGILTPFLYKEVVFSNVEFDEYINLLNDLRTKRGYIRTINNNGNPIKIYPKNMTYVELNKELTINIAEEKQDSVIMTINDMGDFIQINSETIIDYFNYKIIENKVYIYDSSNQLLYKPVYWFNVRVNGGEPSNINQLKNWLTLLN
jgi:hypothetical protein